MESNKLIAEFMGAVGTPMYNPTEWDIYITGYLDVDSNDEKAQHFYTPSEMKYHTSWDWLMPLIEKIEILGYRFEKNYQPIDKDWQCLIVKGNDILYQEFSNNSLDASYYVVSNFINDYNNQFKNK
jgi:hypothetical protein